MAFDVMHSEAIKNQAADSPSIMERSRSDTFDMKDNLPTYLVETIEGSIEEA